MRSNFVSLAMIGLLSIGGLHDSIGKENKEADCSTLSEMGIDFGAAELGRFAELGLSDKQKNQALSVVRDRQVKIEKLCARMTKALAMKEVSLEKKKAKELEITAIVGEFKAVQTQIMTGLHAILTEGQMTELVAMKKRERVEEAKAKAEGKKEAAG